MKGFPFIWLLFNTKTGKVVLGVLAFAIFFVLGMLYYKYYEDNRYNDNWPTAEDFKKIKNFFLSVKRRCNKRTKIFQRRNFFF